MPVTDAQGDAAINNKKRLIVIAALAGLVFGWHFLLLLAEEIVELAFEWTHKTLDFLYTDVLGFGDDAAQKASAWTLFLLVAVLAGRGGYALAMTLWKNFLRAKAELTAWWSALAWPRKLGVILVGLAVAWVLAMLV